MNRWVSAKVPKGYGFCLPRWGSRVRTPSRALFYCLRICVNTWVLGIFVFCKFLENRLTPVDPLTVEMAKVRHFLSVLLIIVKTVCKKFVASSALVICSFRNYSSITEQTRLKNQLIRKYDCKVIEST